MDTQHSAYVLERNQMLKDKILPSVSRVKQMLSTNFSKVFFELCEQPIKELIGLEPKLEGVSGDLWTSPSDLLIGKVCLKPPLTTKHIRALTHKGILGIGHDIEKKFWNMMEIEKENAMKTQAQTLRAEFDIELRNIGMDVMKEEQKKCEKAMKKMDKEFEIRLKNELAALEAKLKDTSHLTAMLNQQKEQLDAEWQEKLEEEVRNTMYQMSKQCIDEMEKQEKIMLQNFEIDLRQAEVDKKYAIEEERAQCRNLIQHLKHELECKNLSNMMYILCMERRKCKREKDFMKETYEQYIMELNKAIINRDQQIETFENELLLKEAKLEIKDICVTKILEQFQKFINYALKAAPTQAEFLLNINKLMSYELSDSLARHAGNISSTEHAKPCKTVHEWLKPKESASTIEKEDALIIEDHHQCFNEKDLPRDRRPSTDHLPMFYYNKKMYVREDFRNRFSQDIKMSPSNQLWNEDVESLMNILKKSLDEYDAIDAGSNVKADAKSDVRSETKSDVKPDLKSDYEVSIGTREQTSNVHFSIGSLHSQSMNSATDQCRKPSLRLKTSYTLVDFTKVGKEESKKTLLAATNSLELIRHPLSKLVIHEENADATIDPSEMLDDNAPCPEIEACTKPPDVVEATTLDIVTHKIVTPNKSSDAMQGITQIGSVKMISQAPSTDVMSDINFAFDTNVPKPKPPIEICEKSDKKPTIQTELVEKGSKLITARDSLVLAKELEISKELEVMLEEKLAKGQDSITINKNILTKEIGYTDDDYMKTFEVAHHHHKPSIDKYLIPESRSRLSHTRDSVELIRESKKNLYDQKQPAPIPILSPSKDLSFSEKEISGAVDYEEHKEDTLCRAKASTIFDFKGRKLPKMYKSIAKHEVESRRDSFLKKPNSLKIVGDPVSQEYRQSPEEFTADRIHSFINMIKDNPDLIGMFTTFSR